MLESRVAFTREQHANVWSDRMNPESLFVVVKRDGSFLYDKVCGDPVVSEVRVVLSREQRAQGCRVVRYVPLEGAYDA